MHFETVRLTEISSDDKGESIARNALYPGTRMLLYRVTDWRSLSGNSYWRPSNSVRE